MKSNKTIRTLLVTVTLFVLLTAISIQPVLASENITLNPTEARVGDEVAISGSDFPPSDFSSGLLEDLSSIDIYFSSQQADTYDEIGNDVTVYEIIKSGLIIGEDGEFSTLFEVPSRLADGSESKNVRCGTYYIYITHAGEQRIRAMAPFSAIAATIELDPHQGAAGSEVDIEGTAFAAREDITVEYDDEDVDIAGGDKDTDRDGDFSCTIVIPESTAGEHSITVTDESGSEDEAVFTVKPEIAAVITKGPGGYTVTLKGGGFAGNSQVAISFEDNEVIEDETGKYGSFEVTFPVPVESSGSYEVEAEDEDKNSDRTKFTIAGVITISPENSNAGSQVTVSGSGFKPYTSVSISYADDAGPAVVASSTSDAQGSFSTAFTIPESKHGAHIISATDGSNTGTAMFTMESTPPSTPLPLAPETGDRTKPEARFDWDAVNDPSGVSYTLQIAIDAEFSESSIVLEKTGLLQSEYTLSEEENLEPTDKEMPYYWRVMAVDGAANEGTASEPVSFSVRSGLPAPPRAVLYVLGALLIGFAGFWVGKRYGLRRAIG